MKRIFLFLIVIALLIGNMQGNYTKTEMFIELNRKILELQLEKETSKKSLKMKITKDREFLIFDYSNNKYDEIVKKLNEFEEIDLLMAISESYGYDWKLFAVQIFYESSYDENAISWAGAKGLMQLTNFVYGKDSDPFNNIHNVFIGITYYHYLDKECFYYITDDNERTKFTLAAYHDGIGNIQKYRNFVKNRGLNPNTYSNIERYLSKDGKKYVSRIIKTYNEIEFMEENV